VGMTTTRRLSVPDFLIVGTPRSGTTLVQRIACELPGVRVPPETHFWHIFAIGLLRRRTFPLDAAALRQELSAYSTLEATDGLDLNVDRIIEDLHGHCADAFELFGSIVRSLAGDANTYGEKTPPHLRWWRPLAKTRMNLKIVAVVRDPRAVVASNLQVPFSMTSHVLLAMRWALEQREVARAQTDLGSERFLVLRYEDVVLDPAHARRKLRAFLELSDTGSGEGPVHHVEGIFLPHEWWKKDSIGPVTVNRVDAWTAFLTPSQAADVVAICGSEMKRFGYIDSPPDFFTRWSRLVRLGPRTQWRRLRFLFTWHRRLARINGTIP
jgi:hypothetical protein